MAFNRKFINEIFTNHQPLYSKTVMKAMFERLARASTIRVNSESLDKVHKPEFNFHQHHYFQVSFSFIDVWVDDYGCQTPNLCHPESEAPDHGHIEPFGRYAGLHLQYRNQEKYSFSSWVPNQRKKLSYKCPNKFLKISAPN